LLTGFGVMAITAMTNMPAASTTDASPPRGRQAQRQGNQEDRQHI
jgi:hypothetical protein